MNHITGKLPESLGEILETLWTLEEEGHDTICQGPGHEGAEASPEQLEELERRDMLTVESARRVLLTREGRKVAAGIIRRHRLAERLICDVLGVHVADSEDAACEFEHILADGIANSICTMLGHPRVCPHGKAIPEGDCCRAPQGELRSILISSDQLDVGESAPIAYLCATEHARMLKLSSLGMTPGNRLKLLQKWPSCVFECDETEIAVDSDVARSIYVRRDGRGQAPGEPPL